MLLFPSYSPYLITLAINFSFDNHRSCLACRCQFTLIFRFSSIARYRSRDCDKLVVVRGGISRTNFPASPLHHTGFASDFPTKESLLFELTLLSTMLGCCKSAPKKSNSRIFFFCGEKIKLFSARLCSTIYSGRSRLHTPPAPGGFVLSVNLELGVVSQ